MRCLCKRLGKIVAMRVPAIDLAKHEMTSRAIHDPIAFSMNGMHQSNAGNGFPEWLQESIEADA